MPPNKDLRGLSLNPKKISTVSEGRLTTGLSQKTETKKGFHTRGLTTRLATRGVSQPDHGHRCQRAITSLGSQSRDSGRSQVRIVHQVTHLCHCLSELRGEPHPLGVSILWGCRCECVRCPIINHGVAPGGNSIQKILQLLRELRARGIPNAIRSPRNASASTSHEFNNSK